MGSAGALFKQFLKPYWKAILLIVGLNMVIGFTLSLRPLLLAPALGVFVKNQASPAENFTDISLNNLGPTLISVFNLDSNDILNIGIVVGGLFVLFTVLVAVLSMISQTIVISKRTAVLRDMVVALHRHLLTLPLSYFHSKRVGDLVSRVYGDVTMTAGYLDSIARGFLQSCSEIIITMLILFHTDALFASLILALGTIHIFVTKALGTRFKKRARELTDMMGGLSASLMETFSGIRIIKSFAAEKYDADKITDSANLLRKYQNRFKIMIYAETPLRLVIDSLIIGVILILMFYSVKEERLTLSEAALFFYLAQRIIKPVSELFKQLLGIQAMLGGAERIIEMFETKNLIPDGVKHAGEFKNSLVLQDVSFSYEKNQPVLEHIDLKINRGEMTAIVGPSGSGKSTLTDLMLRLYDVESGSIIYDSTDIRQFTQESYRRKFGVVSQECLLFNTTVKENIIYNRPENDEDLAHAIWAANAEEFIKELPDGVDTLVGDRGTRLSGGQRQRIAIARAIYVNPSILILDEATSSLDSESERNVQEAINRISKEVTTIVIAHRLSTVTHADKIVVLNNGHIEAIGPHNIVVETSPTYKRLYNLQFANA